MTTATVVERMNLTMDEIKTTALSRRRLLARTALAAGAAAGAGTLLHSGPTSRAEAALDRTATTLTVMYNVAEISRQEIQLFEKQNPGITVKQLEFDPVRL